MNTIKTDNSNPFHPLFAAIAWRAQKADKKDVLTNDGNQRVALVNYADKLLKEISVKVEKYIIDYNADTERLKKSYNSMKWFSGNTLAKLYVALNLRIPQDDFINLTDVKEEPMFDAAIELLNDAGLIELEGNKHLKIKITNKGKEYLSTLK